MKILNLKIMRGPNYWSNYRQKLIVLKIDLEAFAKIHTDQIQNFVPALKALIPSLHEHRCSPGVPGGFFQRLDKGTLLGHVIEHVALELQHLAGMNCGYGRARAAHEEGVYHVVFSYIIENAGVYAAEAAFNIVSTLALGQPVSAEEVERHVQELKDIYAEERFGPSTEAILEEASRRVIPCSVIRKSMVMLGHGYKQKLVSATLSHHTSCIGVDLVADKKLTKEILESEYIPIPNGHIVHNDEELREAVAKVGYPLVIKPRFGNHGKGITTNITSIEKVVFAYEIAKKYSHSIVVERFVQGDDYRFLLINYKLVAVAKRIPAHVVGNGVSTIEQLIEEINQNPSRGRHHENNLTAIKVDESTLAILEKNNLSLQSIPEKNQIIYLKDAANISTGGTSVDVTDRVHPHNVFLAERIARLINLDVCGIDLIAEDIAQPITNKNGAVLEVNAAPGFRMHLAPSTGIPRNVAKPFVDMLFPNNETGRIPTIAVTGTNGKTTVVRMIAHITDLAGYTTGFSTTEGIYLHKTLIYEGDCSGPFSASIILRDPMVEFAVLECARGGILRSGLGFDHCNVSIVTNISEDHLGQEGIHTLEDLTKVKAVVPHSTLKEGFAILNADDELVYNIKNELHCNVALFSITSHPRIHEHCRNGGVACYVENGMVVINDKNNLLTIGKVSDIPITFSGQSECMIQNVLPVALSCYLSHIPLDIISKGLLTFYPTEETLPGRMNLIRFNHCKVMVDYAHNETAYEALRDFLKHVKAKKKIGVIAGTGDRRSIDIWKTGAFAAEMFDEIIIRQDKDSRGRLNSEIINLILDGIRSINSETSINVIPDEYEAIEYAIRNAPQDSFIWYFPDKVLQSIQYLKQIKHAMANYPQENLI